MSGAPSRLRSVLNHLHPQQSSPNTNSSISSQSNSTPSQNANTNPRISQPPHLAPLSPTFFLERAASIEPDATAVIHLPAGPASASASTPAHRGTTTAPVPVPARRLLRRTYAELADRARGLAYYLRKRGRRRVAVVAPNTPAFLECVYAVVAAGAVLVPVNYRLKREDVGYILAWAEVDAVVVDWEFEGLVRAALAESGEGKGKEEGMGVGVEVEVIVDLDTDPTAGDKPGPYDNAIREGLEYDRATGGKGWAGLVSRTVADEDGVIAIPFTSGTTSKPKGVVYTHRGAYLASLANVVESGLNPPDGRCTYLWTLPMFHAVGWTFPWSVCAVRGTHVCLRKIDYPLIWRLLKEEGITHFNAAPTVNTLLCAHQDAERLHRPVRVTVAASPPTAHLFEQMTDLNLLPVHVYGMTETYGPITRSYVLPAWDALPRHEKYANMARQGHGFLTSLPVRVVKPDQPEGVLVDVARDGREMGEIVFEGNICCKGYYKDPEATRKLFAGGVLHSGDLAVWHPDGSVQIQDRAKDIIISGGENISSVALESMLVEHPAVLEAGVVAVPDPRWGERPKAYLTVKRQDGRDGGGAGPGPNPGPHARVRPQDIIDWARNQSAISRFMVPREVEIVRELPKTSTGKIRKNVLREWARKGTPADVAVTDE